MLKAYGLGHNYFANGYLVHNALYSKTIVNAILFDWLGRKAMAGTEVHSVK